LIYYFLKFRIGIYFDSFQKKIEKFLIALSILRIVQHIVLYGDSEIISLPTKGKNLQSCSIAFKAGGTRQFSKKYFRSPFYILSL